MSELKYDNEVVTQAEKSVETETRPRLTAQERRCAQHLMTILPQIRRVINRDHEGLEFPLTMQQYAALKALSEHSYLISELADKFKVSRPTMTRIIDGLEGRRKNGGLENEVGSERRPKLVERVESQEDRRLVYACITAEGKRILDCYYLKAEESAVAMLRNIPPEQMSLVENAFEVLQHALDTTKI